MTAGSATAAAEALGAEAGRIRHLTGVDPSFRDVPPERLAAAAAALDTAGDIDGFRLAAMRLMALAGNGHSRAIANAAVTVVPLRLAWLADGPCLARPFAAIPAGARLVAVNGVGIASVFAALRPWLAGTDQRARVIAGMMLAWPPAVAAATGVAGASRL